MMTPLTQNGVKMLCLANQGDDEQFVIDCDISGLRPKAELFEIKGDGRVGLSIQTPSVVNQLTDGSSHEEERF